MIHACGQVDLVDDIAASDGVVAAARSALRAGAPILCDAMMVASGVTAARLPADNEVLCLLRDTRVPDHARRIGNTRSAAALELLADRFEGAVVAIGNAPTALFHVLDLIDRGDAPARPRSSASRSGSSAPPSPRWPCPSGPTWSTSSSTAVVAGRRSPRRR